MAVAKQKKSYRLLWKFWLDTEKPEESRLSDYCGQLKEQRLYTSSIRDGLRLLRDLRQESLTVLFELFPWINAWLEERAQAIAEAMVKTKADEPTGGEGQDIKALQASIERLEIALLQQHTGNAIQAARLGDDRTPRLLPPPVSSRTHAGKIAAIPANLPDFEVAKVAPEKGKAYANFMSSLSGMSTKPVAQKPARKPRAKRQEPPTTDQDTQLVVAIDEAKPRIIAGADAALAAPSFDDLDMDF